MEIILSLPNLATTHQLGETLGRSLAAGSILLIAGEMGSGKTTLVQGIGQGLGISDPIVSPTFTLINEYLEGRLPLYHFDLYRLQSSQVEALHLETYWEGAEVPLGVVAIEWAERLNYRPVDSIQINLTTLEVGRQAMLTTTGKEAIDLTAIGTTVNKLVGANQSGSQIK
jgi:tRNA threonylcarbamoyladenosine biosynthesis protein TsaE